MEHSLRYPSNKEWRLDLQLIGWLFTNNLTMSGQPDRVQFVFKIHLLYKESLLVIDIVKDITMLINYTLCILIMQPAD